MGSNRTVLTPEPELGRKRLDLLKLYKKVTEAGGYDHCTTEKGELLVSCFPVYCFSTRQFSGFTTDSQLTAPRCLEGPRAVLQARS